MRISSNVVAIPRSSRSLRNLSRVFQRISSVFPASSFLLCGLLCAATSLPAANVTPFELVDPLIGTANEGQTYPVVGMPFGMTGWTPETQPTEAKCISPYYYKDTRITGFRGSHWLSGSCTQEYGSVTLMPTTGELKVSPAARSSSFRHQTETSTPAYYSVLLDDYSTRVELAGTTRSGMLRFTFPENAVANILVEPNSRPGEGYVQVRADRNEIVGYNPVHRLYQGAGEPAGFSGYFVARFDHSFSKSGVWCGEDIRQGTTEQSGGCKHLGAFITFPHLQGGKVLIKVGTSFTSIEEAEKNLDTENAGWSFDKVEQSAEAAWRTLLGRIEVQGGTGDQRSTFYTALFHASLVPRVVSDADGTYNGFANEGKLHNAGPGRVYYDDFSLWDTFRAFHPLLTILDPSRDEQMVQSLLAKGEQGGFMPIFPTWNHYTSEMIGDHATAVIVDAYSKGLHDFDVEAAYRLVRQNAMVTPPDAEYKEGKGRRALPSYLQYGYIPLEDKVLDAFHQQEQVSRTLEYAYDDSLAATFAHALGKEEDARDFAKRSEYWRNVFDPAVGFARGRYQNGTWSEPFDPGKAYPYITEGVPWQYTFFVPQNIAGLIQAMGGNAPFIAKLDGLFAAKLYDQGNEPSHHIAYLYDYAGSAWKTQLHLRQIMHDEFHTGPAGLPGNDDAGQMSAWYVLSAMGFYSVCPGRPVYALGSPIFSRVVIHQPNGKNFTILAPASSSENKYIQSAELDGLPYNRYEITHADIVRGATLRLNMSAKPNPKALQEK
ncbi:MAG TPA: GH92 family glycosyl hydrolase [Acidisarcina sp.]|nr:GH92 family glycosyl hydrolase [Acidisarcina sp.]